MKRQTPIQVETLWLCASVAVLGAFVTISAAQFRGLGRINGKVTDDSGAPVEGVAVVARLPAANGEMKARTNKKGEWAIGGIAGGEWQVDFAKEGYDTRQISVGVREQERLPPIEIVLKKAAVIVDPNVEIKEALVAASKLLDQKKFAEARASYEALLEKYPEVHQLQPLIARTYHGEKQYDKSIEHLRLALQKDPENVEVKLLLGNILVEAGKADEGRKVLEALDEAKVKDPTTFLNVGIALFNQNKPAEAVIYFDKTVTRFPDYPDGYYYRGITRLQTGDHAAAKADLTKFVAMAPSAPEAATAKKILEQLK
jgi:tetratricopeptide (TPR) repeat protein